MAILGVFGGYLGASGVRIMPVYVISAPTPFLESLFLEIEMAWRNVKSVVDP